MSLLERWPSLGGMATNALVNIWHTSDRQKQVIHGFAQEAIERAGEFMHRYPDYPKRPETHWFDPEGMRVVFWKMLRDRGVRVICDVTAIESIVEGGRIGAVLVDTKTGRKAVPGKVFIDATGDGDVPANAGVPFDLGREDGRVQGMTMMFELRGVDAAVVRALPREEAACVLKLMQEQRDQEESLQVRLSCPTFDTQIRYTLDGSEPAKTSMLYQKPFRLDGSAIVSAKAFAPRGAAGPAVSVRFERGETRPCLAPDADALKANLKLWLSAGTLARTLKDGVPVSIWPAVVGPAATVPTAELLTGATPAAPAFVAALINGQPGVRFDGVDDPDLHSRQKHE